MIGKFKIGKGFGGCIAYCLEDKKISKEEMKRLALQNTENKSVFMNRAEVLHYNDCFGNKKELIEQFNDVRKLNPRQSKPVLHITMSFAENERLSKHQLCQIAEQCAKEFGFAQNQYLLVEHNDTATHQHIHIVANRIGFNGKTNVSDSNSYQKMANFCRKREQQYNLHQTLSPRKFLPKHQRLLPRTDKRKEAIREKVELAITQSNNMESFIQHLSKQNIIVEKSRGISFTDDKKVKLKGSDINYSLAKVEKLLLSQHQTLQAEFIKINHPKKQHKLKITR